MCTNAYDIPGMYVWISVADMQNPPAVSIFLLLCNPAWGGGQHYTSIYTEKFADWGQYLGQQPTHYKEQDMLTMVQNVYDSVVPVRGEERALLLLRV